MKRRVVVTGLGLVTPLGADVSSSWSQLKEGQSGIRPIHQFDTTEYPCRIAGSVPQTFAPDQWMSPKDVKKVDTFIVYGMAAACQAVEDAGLAQVPSKERVGVMIGSGIGGLSAIYETSLKIAEKGPRRVTPFFIPACLINSLAGYVSIKYGFEGPNQGVVTACATGAHALGDAANLIRQGTVDAMIAGGAEAAICPPGMAGFSALRALSTRFNQAPTTASRPWDVDRDGFVMGEGAGVMVLESLEHAQARGAKIYGEILGYGATGDGHHITAPREDGAGVMRAMTHALQDAQLNATDIDYINAHGTSTPLGDDIEVRAVEKIFAKCQSLSPLYMSSTKSATGHLLGAAGGVESIFSLLALIEGYVPPTLNLHNPSYDTWIDCVPHTGKEVPLRYAMSNSFGFGGTNASLIFGRYEGEKS